MEGDAAVEARAAASEQQEDTGENKAAMAKEATDKAHYPDYDASLAKSITNYILDKQDDAAQEERWRTTMKRETVKRFREQREASDKQREQVQKVETEMPGRCRPCNSGWMRRWTSSSSSSLIRIN